ncbi:unnamed protein product [Clonostachys rosea f. rosea IK726]|uniref:Uncharacterized protein n=1 Tax=Clonostachys rosea f. rosea IK726 TaxID=1349383 RepID=A0ACA9UEC1_BIOOC|nr:unnamed protein product [Clonostachys rosea f. rosea IK726]
MYTSSRGPDPRRHWHHGLQILLGRPLRLDLRGPHPRALHDRRRSLPKLEEKGKAVNLNCGLLIVKECKHDINDPQVKKWKFEVRAQCTGAMVAKAIKAATGQKSVSCDIGYDKNKWP